MNPASAVRRRALVARAQAERLRLAVHVVEWSGPLHVVDRVAAGVALARRHPLWTGLALVALAAAWAPARRLGVVPLLGLLARRWIGA